MTATTDTIRLIEFPPGGPVSGTDALYGDQGSGEVRLTADDISGYANAVGVQSSKYAFMKLVDNPLASMTRDGAVRSSEPHLKAGLLDITVIGAKPGKYYRLEWYGNGTTAFGTPNYQMLFSEYDATTYATNSASNSRPIIALNDVRSSAVTDNAVGPIVNGVVTRYFNGPKDSSIAFLVTYDTNVFAGAGVIQANLPGGSGYCHIIDPSCYRPFPVSLIPAASGAGTNAVFPLAYSLVGGVLTYAMRLSGTYDIKLTFGPVGNNSLNNYGNVYVAPHSGTPPSVTNRDWLQVCNAGSDWLGPYVIEAVNNPDPSQSGRSGYFTGGSHGTTNQESGGNPTARCLSYQMTIDGAALDPAVAVISGTCREIVISLVNNIQPNNALREVLQEAYLLKITAGATEVLYRNTPLEQVKIKKHYGLQICASGFQSSVHFVNGWAQGRQTISAGVNLNAGPYSSNPNVYWIACRGQYGDVAMWIDSSFGIVPARPIDPTQTAGIFQPYSGAGKAYEVMVLSTTGVIYNPGAGYMFRGGYVWGSNLSNDQNVDCSFRYTDNGAIRYAVTFSFAASASVVLSAQDRNRSLSYVSGTGDAFAFADVTTVSAQKYGVVNVSVG
ncbi:hypothetical protein [Paraburkholderia dioscoreae]|uniref:Uncharacterized protein n=1 Tax=Paraburkholderia dioscoreae TaxID=2604047 RepID=A0A5Q4Z735_9BURK|nr:hypothetical protein [Paraburkholderia dioscoreae]VVD29145.1 protein of unknown function [Paraburkholderia dioscoreae]